MLLTTADITSPTLRRARSRSAGLLPASPVGALLTCYLVYTLCIFTFQKLLGARFSFWIWLLGLTVSFSSGQFPQLVRYAERNSRAWCKTIVTTLFYIRRYNSFAPSSQIAVMSLNGTLGKLLNSYSLIGYGYDLVTLFALMAVMKYILVLYPGTSSVTQPDLPSPRLPCPAPKVTVTIRRQVHTTSTAWTRL